MAQTLAPAETLCLVKDKAQPNDRALTVQCSFLGRRAPACDNQLLSFPLWPLLLSWTCLKKQALIFVDIFV